MKPLLVFTAPLSSRSGYGECARDFAKYLLTKTESHEIYFISTKWGNTPDNALSNDPELSKAIESRILYERPSRDIDIHFHLSLPNEFRDLGKTNIGLTAGVETTKWPVSFVSGCNRMDLVILPSKFTQETLLKADYINETTNERISCTTPTEVVFEGYDETIYDDTDTTTPILADTLSCIKEPFCYMFVGHWMTQYSLGNDRKNIGMLIKTFLETFVNEPTPPALILKTNGTNVSHMDQASILAKINEIQNTVQDQGNLPNIYLLHGDLTPTEMCQLYNHPQVKCHITLTHGEGFCRPLLEATLSEKPIIAPKWSGYLDYLNYKHSILLPGDTEPIHPSVHTHTNNFTQDAEWFTVDYAKSIELIRDVYLNYDKHRQRAIKVKKYTSENYTLTKMYNKYDTVLESVLKAD